MIASVWMLAAACGGAPGAPTTPTPPTTPSSDDGSFHVAVLLSAAKTPTSDDVRRIVLRANGLLFQKTGYKMSQTDLVTAGPGSAFHQAQSYVNAQTANLPDGVLAFSDDVTATTYGGYSQYFSLPAQNVSRFPSPVAGENQEYLAVIDFFHMYARCGYDDSGNRIGTTSANGECRNRPGMTCVNNGRYWMCPDALNDLYSDPDYFTACGVVHEFMHPFGPAGNFDHYGTAQCIARTGMSAADAQSLSLAQQNCGMCPDVYRQFKHR